MLQQYNPKNADIKVHVGGRLIHREEAKVSVFDSVVQGGDAVWEGLRVYNEGIFCLEHHLERLHASARALAFENVPSKNEIKNAIFETLKANQMRNDVHIRLTLTRGEKVTSGMDPRLNTKGCCLIVLAEWKKLVYNNATGIRVITSTQRRNGPQFLDSKIHHNNLLNNIIAKIQANVAGVDAALMLDDRGFASELNDTNIFIARNGRVFTPHADACLPGITRSLVMDVCDQLDIQCEERNLSLTEVYNADEMFACGTMGELTPITEVDGRKIVNRTGSSLMNRIADQFHTLIPQYAEPLPF